MYYVFYQGRAIANQTKSRLIYLITNYTLNFYRLSNIKSFFRFCGQPKKKQESMVIF